MSKIEENNVEQPIEPSKEQKGVLIINRFKTNQKVGLTQEQVDLRNEQNLNNQTKKGSQKSILRIILENIFTVFNLITFAVAGWLISVGSFKDLFFIVIVLLNLIIGIIQEIRAKLTIDKLSLVSSPTAVVIRDSNKKEIPINEIVLDDVMYLTSGKEISVDASVLDGSIEVNESLLTGESDPVVKKKGDKLLSGSFVISGNCVCKVDKVGKDSYIERLASQAKIYKKPSSHLLKTLKILISVIFFLIIPISIFMYKIQYANALADINVTQPYYEAVIRTSSSIIGMIPAGLFLTTSVTLAVGVIRLAKKNTLVQDLYCIEMLARVNTLCLDKTGTITDGTMSVKGIDVIENTTDLTIKQIISMMQYSIEDDNMTSQALKREFGVSKKVNTQFVIPFSSVRKFSGASYTKYGTFLLGAPEFILKKKSSKINELVEKHAKKGYRVLLLAQDKKVIKKIDELKTINPNPIALILIEDHIRPDAMSSIQYFKDSGVDIKVISGDNVFTASMVAKRAGIADYEKVISLEDVSDDEIFDICDQYTVFGRVSPKQKKLLIESLKKKERVVAMTGDGVNDILALREADCSIAMASGSEAARNASHLVLLDSNFSSLPSVVQEGRRAINNIERVATLFLTKTFFTIILSLIIIGSYYVLETQLFYPIELKQMNIIEFLGIGIPAFFLALEANNNLIEGKFLLNVIKKVIPGVIVIILNFIILFGLKNHIGIDAKTLSTMSLIVTGFASLMVLYRVCQPFNNNRKILFWLMFTLFVASLTLPFIRKFLELQKLDVPQVLLVALLLSMTNTLLDFFISMPNKVKEFFQEKIQFKKIKIIIVNKEKDND